MKTTLIFIRHGDLEGERKDILHTPDDQVSLSEKGRAQMLETAEVLKLYGPGVLIASDEKRTVESAHILSESLGIEIETTNALKGRSWGEFSGKTWEEVGKQLGSLSLDERYVFVPPGGESWKEFEGRLSEEVGRIARKYEGKTVAIVAHGSAVRVLLPVLFGVTKEESLKMYPDYASISVVMFEDGVFDPGIFNSTKHLV
jgi:broad specificity phosphatase PhoE